MPRSRRHLAPFGERRGPVLLEVVAGGEVTVEVEEVVDRGVGGSELLQGLDVPEIRHGAFASPERLMRIFGSIIEPAAALLASRIADDFHRRPV